MRPTKLKEIEDSKQKVYKNKKRERAKSGQITKVQNGY